MYTFSRFRRFLTQNLSFAVFLEAYKTFPPFSFYLCLLKNLWTNCIRFWLNSSSFARKAELELRFYQLFPEEEDLALLPQGGLRLGPRERFALLVFCDYTFSLCVLFTQSCVILCDPMDCSPPGSSVRGILQAKILEWVAIPFSRGCNQPRDGTQVYCNAGRFSTIWATSWS